MTSRALTPVVVGLVTVCFGPAWTPLRAGTNANGFFDEYLTAVGYKNPWGATPSVGQRSADYLCDGVESESTIIPEDGLVLGLPVLDPADCTGSDPAAVGLGAFDPALEDGFHNLALLNIDGNLPITSQLVGGITADALDFDALSGGADNAMGYAWVYIHNKTGSILDLTMGVASDDSITVEVNRVEVANISRAASSGAEGTVQNRFPVTLGPGWNLAQFKLFEGGVDWNFRARLEDPENCRNLLSGGPLVDVDVALPPGESIPEAPPVSRTISAAGQSPGQVTADVTVSVDNGGQPYSLEETFDAGWSASNMNPVASQVGAGFVRWNNTTAATVSYRLERSDEWGSSRGGVSGAVTTARGVWSVGGDDTISGGLPEYVGEVLLTAALDIGEGLGVDVELQGCNVTAAEIEGDWITGVDGDGNPVSDADITPFDGMTIFPDFSDGLGGGVSQSFGLDQEVIGFNGEIFWDTLGDWLGGMVLQRVTSGDGFYSMERGDIYGVGVDDSMCIGFFYVTNPDAAARKVIIAFGSDDAGAVRVNGCPAHTIAACRGDPGWANADRFQAVLRPGKNLIQCYAFENGGAFNFRVRFEDANFEPLPMGGNGLIVDLDPSGYTGPDDPCADKFFFYVPEVLVTASFNMLGVQGCNVTADQIKGDWITNTAGTISDANIVPSEGMVITPDYGANAPLIDMLDALDTVQESTFWDDPADPQGGSVLVAVGSAQGFFDWQRADIYNSDPDQTMNVAFFYVVSEEDQCVQIAMGTDDAAGLRVNGRPTHAAPVCRGDPGWGGADRFLVWLDAGKNLIACYTFENGGGYNMRIRFENPDTGIPMALETTLDPAGYNPANHPPPPQDCAPVETEPAPYMRWGPALGLVTQYLVPDLPLDSITAGNSPAGALPEDYISQSGGPPFPEQVFEGATVEPGTSGTITTMVRGAAECGFATLVKYDGFVDGNPGDPSLFEGEGFYGNQDQYSSSMFFHINNKTNDELEAWFGFASDDAATLFVNNVLVAEYLIPRGYGGANVLQTSAQQPAVLEPGDNLVMLSYNEAGGGSGGRVGFFTTGCFDEVFTEDQVEVSANPPGLESPAVTATRTIGVPDCDGNGTVTLTFNVPGGGMEQAELSEDLPAGATGSNPSAGSFDGAGSVLTFSGMVSDGMQITYDVAGMARGLFYCLATVNDIPVSGDFAFRDTTDVCEDEDVLEMGYFINCGAAQFTDNLGRVWLEDTLSNPSKHLVSPNANTATFAAWDSLNPPDTASDQLIAAREYPWEIFPSERWQDGDVIYRFSGLPQGCYEVVLLFMEGCCSDGCVSDGTPACDAVRVPQDGQPPSVDPADPVVSAGGCRVFDILLNGEIGADQFSQNALAACIAGTAPGAPSNGIAVSQRFLLDNVDSIEITIDDLGAGNPPENASIKGIAIRKLTPDDPEFENCAELPAGGLVRGDADSSGRINLTDGVQILNWLFLGGPAPVCLDASDTDDSGTINLTDAVRIFNWLFTGGPAPVGPSPSVADYAAGDCGPDLTPDADGQDLGCVQKSAKCGV